MHVQRRIRIKRVMRHQLFSILKWTLYSNYEYRFKIFSCLIYDHEMHIKLKKGE